MKLLAAVFMSLLSFCLCLGCSSVGGGAGSVTAETPIQDWKGPDWIMKGTVITNTAEGKVFYGVGSVVGIQNAALMRTTADNRARNEIAKLLNTYTASLSKDYQESVLKGGAGNSEVQLVEQVIKTVASATLSGVEIVDHWQHPKTGEFFARARLDLSTFKQNINAMGSLDDKAKESIRKNADRIYEQVEREQQKP